MWAMQNETDSISTGKPIETIAENLRHPDPFVRAAAAQTLDAIGDGAHSALPGLLEALDDRNGTVRTQQVFRATAPVSGPGNTAFVAGLDAAFAKVTADIVAWTLRSI